MLGNFVLKKLVAKSVFLRNLQGKFGMLVVQLLGCLIFTSVLGFFYYFSPPFLQAVNLETTDFILKSSQAKTTNGEVVVVEIDDASLASLGQWPWPRNKLAELLTTIGDAKPAVVGVDILFPERDRTSPILLQQTLKGEHGYTVDMSGIPEEYLDNDVFLADALSQGPFVLGYEFLFGNRNSEALKCTPKPVPLMWQKMNSRQTSSVSLHSATGIICNYPVLAESVNWSGFLNGNVDNDGVVRRLPLVIGLGDEVYPSFALAVLLQYFGSDVLVIEDRYSGIPNISLNQLDIPVGRHGQYMLGPPIEEQATRISAVDILEGKIDTRVFAGKIVLVGLTATGLNQTFPTLLSSETSLLDIHRHSIECLLYENIAVRPYSFHILEIAASILLMLLIVFSCRFWTPAWSILNTVVLVCLVWVGCYALNTLSGYLFSPLLPTMVVLASCCLALLIRFQYLQSEARQQAGVALTQLKSSEHSLDSILKTIPDIVFRLDSKGRIIYLSPAIASYVDNPALLQGQSIFQLVSPEDLNRAQFRMNERRTGVRATKDLEISLQFTDFDADTKNGKRYFSVSTQGIYENDNITSENFLGTQGIVKDITEKKQLELELLQAQKMEVVGTLAAGIAHDLNNILSGLVSYPDLLLREIDQDNPLHEKITVIQKSGKKAATIVQDLLTLARRNTGTALVCDLNDIVREYIESLEFQQLKQEYADVLVQLALAENLLNIKGSVVHLSKVVMNVLQNALEAMGGKGSIYLETKNVYLDSPRQGYETIKEGEYVCFSVSDDGAGISKEDLPRVFEPFYTKKSLGRSGTGLGMSIIWATIKDHGGFIDIKSSEGVGTTITIYLPSTRETMEQLESAEVVEDYGGREKIMVIDDIAEQRKLAKHMLESVGYEVITMSSGEKAVAFVKENPVDLIVLDMIMPGGWDGLETYRQIVQYAPEQKAVITSGYSASERVAEVQSLGGGQYVQKPFSMQTLLNAIRDELDRDPVQG